MALRIVSRSRHFFGALVAASLATSIFTAQGAPSVEVFKLREVSVFDGNHESFLRGQICRCQDKPFAEVKNYPAFASRAPIFGAVKLGGTSDDTNSGAMFYFAVDESRGTGKGYDRLYFDANRDLDLRNDPPAKVQSNPPDHGYKPSFGGIKAVASFDFLELNLGTNGGRPDLVEVMPRLLLTGDETNTYRYLFFVRTHMFEGDIKIAGERFKASLGNDYTITAELNSPATALELEGKDGAYSWWGGDRISAMHKLHGNFYTFSADAAGELTVSQYQGDLGTFELGPGQRQLTNSPYRNDSGIIVLGSGRGQLSDLAVSGSLYSRDHSVAVGGDITRGHQEEARSCEIPAGDYLPDYLTLTYGRLRLALSQNYHSEGKRQSREGRPPVYGIQIRKDRPFVLDFPNPPEVMFTSPTNQQRVKLGDNLSVMAVLVDPKLDIMIRRLVDTSRMQTNNADGKPLGYVRQLSLDPTVIITRANGERVAEGEMPFG